MNLDEADDGCRSKSTFLHALALVFREFISFPFLPICLIDGKYLPLNHTFKHVT